MDWPSPNQAQKCSESDKLTLNHWAQIICNLVCIHTDTLQVGMIACITTKKWRNFPQWPTHISKAGKGLKKCMDKDMLQALNTYIRVMKNFVWVTDPSVVTVPFCTSRSKPFKAFICHDTKQKKSNNTNIKK